MRNALDDFNRNGLGTLTLDSSRLERTRAVFDEEGVETSQELPHRSPLEFGKESSL